VSEADGHRTGEPLGELEGTFGGRWWDASSPEELATQRAARMVVTGIPAFPECERRIVRTLGPTAEAIMLHQLIYWFSKEGLQDRWSAYLTYRDWREQRGLNRRQVDKGRRRLGSGRLVAERYGNYKRPHYKPDWPVVAERVCTGDEQREIEERRLYLLKGEQSATVPPKGESVETAPP